MGKTTTRHPANISHSTQFIRAIAVKFFSFFEVKNIWENYTLES